MSAIPILRNNTHSVAVGYLCWIFGFVGAHRFYYGKKITGTIWFFTLGLLGIGWLIDLFLIPSMDAEADRKYAPGHLDYTAAWLLLTFLGVFGIHRFYMGKVVTGILWLATGGLCGLGLLQGNRMSGRYGLRIARSPFQSSRRVGDSISGTEEIHGIGTCGSRLQSF